MFYYLILLGFIGFYMLTERQSRYAFVCSWLIILIASGAFYKKAEMIQQILGDILNLIVFDEDIKK